MALGVSWRSRLTTAWSVAARSPKIATTRPREWVSSGPRASRRCDGSGVSTARASSSGPVSAAVAPASCQPSPSEVPLAEISRVRNPRWTRCAAIEAAALTAYSREEAAPVPRWTWARLSMNTVARDCQGCSSRRTMSSPAWALARQWTRRRSSPRRYSRTVTSSALPPAKSRGRLSPEPVQLPFSPITGRATTLGVTVTVAVERKARSSSTRPKGSAARTVTGPRVKRPRTSERMR